MSTPHIRPYGSWTSPITSELIVASTIGLGDLAIEGEDLYWTELRPTENGRSVLVQCRADGECQDLTPPPFNVRSRVHEYGGAAYRVTADAIYFCNAQNQRLYRQEPETTPQPLTPDDETFRYADVIWDRTRDRLICVREVHRGDHQVLNCLVSLKGSAAATAAPETNPGQVLTSGNDFYASPCLHPEGTQLAWLTWNHPNMPWDGTQLWLASIQADGSLAPPQWIAGGPEESIFQPQWSPDGQLYFVSDRTGWWNLYRVHQGQVEPLYPMDAEFGLPQWVFGMSTYGFESATSVICTYHHQGQWHLGRLNVSTQVLTPIPTPYTEISALRVTGDQAVFKGSSPQDATAVVCLDLRSLSLQVLRSSSQLQVDPAYFSIPEVLEFPTEGGRTAYGFFYPPTNPEYVGPRETQPPLLVKSHGGPTAATSRSLSLKIQYWTSRGFAVLDVNYGGSTGYGRAYQLRLRGQWGIVDVDDCVNGAQYLAQQGRVDGDRMAITGSSAGGYTTLAALTFRDTFKAGASYYGIGDLSALARDTHKFEARYLDRLIGPYPEREDLYEARSPIRHVDQLSCPVIFFQGLEDKVVPPNQAEAMVNALMAKGIPVAYLTFADEQHGFRQAANIQRALDSEFYFYARIFGFSPGEAITPIEIQNLQKNPPQ